MAMILLFLCIMLNVVVARVHRVAITQARYNRTDWAVAHHVYFMYDSIDSLPDWEPYLVVSEWPGGEPLEIFGRVYRTVSRKNMSGFTVGIASARHSDFPAHMASIVHVQGAEYFNMIDFMRANRTYPFELGNKYDTMWILPHHAWQGEFLSERNSIPSWHRAPYVWSPHILDYRGKYRYDKGNVRNVGVYESNIGIYKTSLTPMLILNKFARENPNTLRRWEVHGLRGLKSDELTNFVSSLTDALQIPFNVSLWRAEIPKEMSTHSIGTVLSHQFTVGINNLYLEALHMNLALIHNSPFFKDCGYYYDELNVTDGVRALSNALETHDERLDEYMTKSKECLKEYDPLSSRNRIDFKILLDKWIPTSGIVKAARDMQLKSIQVMYAIEMLPMVRSWLCNTKHMAGVHARTLIILDDASYVELSGENWSVTLVPDSSVSSSQYMAYGTVRYWQLVQRRLHIFGDMLRDGQNIFIIEPDAWWSVDPSQYLSTLDADAVGFENSPGILGFGFLKLRSSEEMIRLWSKTELVVDTAMASVGPATGLVNMPAIAQEQIAFSTMMRGHNLTRHVLRQCDFPSGKWYSDSEVQKRCPNPMVIQNNYLAGFDAKVQRAKNWEHWAEKDGKCIGAEKHVDKANRVAITAHDIYDDWWAVIHHVLFMYDTIENTRDWEPLLMMDHNSSEIEVRGKKYNVVPRDTCVEVLVIGSHRTIEPTLKKCPDTHVVYFNQGPNFFIDHGSLLKNEEIYAAESVDTVWTTPQYNWQGEYVRARTGAARVAHAPYVWEPRVSKNRTGFVETWNHVNNRVGVYETNRGVYKMSLVPMMIVERAYEDVDIEYAEAFSLSQINTSVFEREFKPRLKAPWKTHNYFARLPRQWSRSQIGTVVSHTLRNGLNYLWLEAVYYGLALVHNSKFLPDGCGYYYPGENITAGAEALKRAISTHNYEEAEKQKQICLTAFSTSNIKNIDWYERLLDETQAEKRFKQMPPFNKKMKGFMFTNPPEVISMLPMPSKPGSWPSYVIIPDKAKYHDKWERMKRVLPGAIKVPAIVYSKNWTRVEKRHKLVLGHARAWKMALQNGCTNGATFFEDDMIMMYNWRGWLSRILEETDAQVVKFDALPYQEIDNEKLKTGENIALHTSPWACAGGYYLSCAMIQKAVEYVDDPKNAPDNRNVENVLQDNWALGVPVYSTTPRLGIQDWFNPKNWVYSNGGRKVFDNTRRNMAGMQRYLYLPKYGHLYKNVDREFAHLFQTKYNKPTMANILVGMLTATEQDVYFERWRAQTWPKLFANVHTYTFEKARGAIQNIPLLWPDEPHKYRSNLHLAAFQQMYEDDPNSEWYFQVDDDTIVSRPNLQDFLSMRDGYNEMIYAGSCEQTVFSEPEETVYFRRGGAGILISQALMKRLYPHIPSCRREFAHSQFGDMRVGLCIHYKLDKDVSCGTGLGKHSAEWVYGQQRHRQSGVRMITAEAKAETARFSKFFELRNVTYGEYTKYKTN